MTQKTVVKPLDLFLRSGVYQVRVIIPLALQPAYGGRQKVIRSLNTQDPRKPTDWPPRSAQPSSLSSSRSPEN